MEGFENEVVDYLAETNFARFIKGAQRASSLIQPMAAGMF